MSSNIVADYLNFIKEQIVLHKQLLGCHCKAYSILEILLRSNLNDYPASIIHGCLSGVSDDLRQAKALNESLLNVLTTLVQVSEPVKKTFQ